MSYSLIPYDIEEDEEEQIEIKKKPKKVVKKSKSPNADFSKFMSEVETLKQYTAELHKKIADMEMRMQTDTLEPSVKQLEFKEFVEFLRTKYEIPHISRTDMRNIKKLPNTIPYDEKQAISAIMRHQMTFDVIFGLIESYIKQ